MRWACVGCLVVALAACRPQAQEAPAPSGGCRVDVECGVGHRCDRVDGGGRCIKAYCTAHEDCDPQHLCIVENGTCVPVLCNPSQPSGCAAGTRCLNRANDAGFVAGSCRTGVAAPPLEGCLADVDHLTLPVGASRPLTVFGISRGGALHTGLDVVLVTGDPSVADAPAPGVVRALHPGETTVTISTAGAGCAVGVTVLGPVPAGHMRVVVEEQASGLPVTSVDVLVRLLDGRTIQTVTNGQGVALAQGVFEAEAVLDVSVFPPNRTYVTYVLPGTRDALVTLSGAPAPTGALGVRAGMEMAGVGRRSFFGGFVAASPAQALDTLNLGTLAGPRHLLHVDIPNIFLGDVVVPTAAHFNMPVTPLQSNLWVPVSAGCGAGPACALALWGFGGRLRLENILYAVGAWAVPGGSMYELLPGLRQSWHAVELALPPELAEVDGGFGDAGPEHVLLAPAWTTEQAVLQVPPLPTDDGGVPRLTQVFLALGVDVPRLGFVPLGLALANDGCVGAVSDTGAVTTCGHSPDWNGEITCRQKPGEQHCAKLHRGEYPVYHAFPHSGLEPFPLLAWALASNPVEEEDPLRATSMVLSRAMDWASHPGAPLRFPVAAFPAPPRAQWSSARNTLTIQSWPDGANVMDLTLHHSGGDWRVVAPMGVVPAVLQLPSLPSGLARGPASTGLLRAWLSPAVPATQHMSLQGGGLRNLPGTATAVAAQRVNP